MKKSNKLSSSTKRNAKTLFEKYYRKNNFHQCEKLATKYFQLKQEFKMIIKEVDKKVSFYPELSKEEKMEKANSIFNIVQSLMLKEIERVNIVEIIKKTLKITLLKYLAFKNSYFFEELVTNHYFEYTDNEEGRYDFLDIVEKIIKSYNKEHWYNSNILQKIAEDLLFSIFVELEKNNSKIRFYADEYCKLVYNELSIRKDPIFHENDEDILLDCNMLYDDWFYLINPYNYDFFIDLYKNYIYSEKLNQKFETIIKKRLLKAGLLDPNMVYFDPSCIVERNH